MEIQLDGMLQKNRRYLGLAFNRSPDTIGKIHSHIFKPSPRNA